MKKKLFILLPVSLINLVVIFFMTLKLPETVPIHLNASMIVDRYGSRWFVPLIALIPVVLSVVRLIYSRRANSNNVKIENKMLPAIIAFFIIMTWFPVIIAFQYENPEMALNIPMELIVMLPLGILMMIVSNFMGNIKYNKWLGIRVPWTFASETVWRKTHRLGGYTGFVGGFILCIFAILSFLFKAVVLIHVGLISSLVFIVGIPVVYSYIIYNKERAEK